MHEPTGFSRPFGFPLPPTGAVQRSTQRAQRERLHGRHHVRCVHRCVVRHVGSVHLFDSAQEAVERLFETFGLAPNEPG